MVRLRHPSSWMVCLSGCVLHQSSRRYRRSVTCSASWLDSSTSSVVAIGPVPREINPLIGGCWHLSDSFGLYLFGCGKAPWKVAASVLLGGLSSSAKTMAEVIKHDVLITDAERKTHKLVIDGKKFTHNFYAPITHFPNALYMIIRFNKLINRVTCCLSKLLTRKRDPDRQFTACVSSPGPASCSGFMNDRESGFLNCLLLLQNTPPNPDPHFICLKVEGEKNPTPNFFSMQITRLFDFTEQKHKHFGKMKWPKTDSVLQYCSAVM